MPHRQQRTFTQTYTPRTPPPLSSIHCCYHLGISIQWREPLRRLNSDLQAKNVFARRESSCCKGYSQLPSYCICTIPMSNRRRARTKLQGLQLSAKPKRGNLCTEPISNSQVTSFAHWRAWGLLPTPCRSSLPEGADESEGGAVGDRPQQPRLSVSATLYQDYSTFQAICIVSVGQRSRREARLEIGPAGLARSETGPSREIYPPQQVGVGDDSH
jgi:hypothetical protein